jgi:hypothetical protein
MNDVPLQLPELKNLTRWFDVKISSYQASNTRFFAYVNKANRVPFLVDRNGKEGERLLYRVIEDPELDTHCVDLLYLFDGNAESANQAAKAAIDHSTQIMVNLPENVHFSQRYLIEDIGQESVARLYLMRVYRNADFECTEHPEMSCGAPLTQYFCPECGGMQMTGMAHMPANMTDVYRASEI